MPNRIPKILFMLWDLTDSVVMLTVSLLLGQVKDLLGVIGLSVTIFYTLWKWRNEYFDKLRRKTEQEKQENRKKQKYGGI